MQILSPPAILYLEDATPVLEEVITAYATWTHRSLEEKEVLTRWVHDYAVGEDWTTECRPEEDSWADVSFTPEEIQAFSSHIRVPGDEGLPEWYPSGGPRRVPAQPEYETARPSSYFPTLNNTEHDSPSK